MSSRTGSRAGRRPRFARRVHHWPIRTKPEPHAWEFTVLAGHCITLPKRAHQTFLITSEERQLLEL